MLKRVLILLITALAQAGCSIDEGGTMFQPVAQTPESREGLERLKREFLKLEDLKIGDGPVAAWGRKISADIEVRYTDGTVAYRGPAYAYAGMSGGVMIHNNLQKSGAIAFPGQRGLILGLNGMAVGGKRRITIAPKLVCEPYGTEEADPKIACGLVGGNRKKDRGMAVRKETLVVDATLTESCIPVILFIPVIYHGEFRCRDSEAPQRDPSASIWHLYDAEPSRS